VRVSQERALERRLFQITEAKTSSTKRDVTASNRKVSDSAVSSSQN